MLETKVWFKARTYLSIRGRISIFMYEWRNENWPKDCYQHFLSDIGWKRQKCDLPFVFTSNIYILLVSRAASDNNIITTNIININTIDCLQILFFLMLITINSMTMLTIEPFKSICHWCDLLNWNDLQQILVNSMRAAHK